MEDNEILTLYFQRNEQAIGESEKKYGKYCFSIAHRALGTKEDAEECVNDTWLAAWSRIPPAKPDSLRAFFGRITRNLAVSRFRRLSAEKRGGGQISLAADELAEILPASTPTPDEEAETKELTEAVGRFLRSLPEKECSTFLCRYYFLYPTEEIAKKQGLKENYVRTLLSRTRAKLKDYLEKEKLL